MESLHKAQGLHNDGNVDAAREEILRARAGFEAADSVAPLDAKAKISSAIGALDGLSGGLAKDAKKAVKAVDSVPDPEQFLPGIPKPLAEAVKMAITQSLQALNPAEWLTEPDRVFQKFMDVHGLTTPGDVQRFFEERIALEHPDAESGIDPKNRASR